MRVRFRVGAENTIGSVYKQWKFMVGLTKIVLQMCLQCKAINQSIVCCVFRWHAIIVDGHSVEELCKAMSQPRHQPTAIIAKTIKGKGIPGTFLPKTSYIKYLLLFYKPQFKFYQTDTI